MGPPDRNPENPGKRQRVIDLATCCLILFSAVGCSAQSVQPDLSSTAEKRPSTVPRTSTESVPELEVIEFAYPPGPEQGLWEGVGVLENTSSEHLRNMRLGVETESLPDGIQEFEIRPALPDLAPGERSPFTIVSDAPFDEELPKIEVEALDRTPLPRGDVAVENLEVIRLPNGGTGLRGVFRNKSYLHTVVHSLAVLARSEVGEPIAIGEFWTGPTHLPPRRSAPFVAAYSGDIELDHVEAFIDSIEVDDPGEPIIQLTEGLTTHTTEQGQTFLTGLLTNESAQSHQLWMTILAYADEDLIGLIRVDQPVPHTPNEARPFSVFLPDEFTSLVPSMGWSDAEDFELVIDAYHTNQIAPNPAPLDLEITQFEVIGSTLFLRGSLSNPLEVRLTSAAVLGSLRTPDGEVQSAGWFTHPTPLEPLESVDFTLSMPVPVGIQPSEGEFDLQALGVLGS